jgi:glycosyltransferase involved in cell wall biosynthesis
MKILILTTSHPYQTAGVAAYDIYKGFKQREGNEVRMVVKIWDKYPDKDIVAIDSYLSYLKGKIIRKLLKIVNKYGVIKQKVVLTDPDFQVQNYNQTKEYYSTKKILKKARIKPDVIFIVFAHGFLTYRNLFELNKLTGVPIYWQLADMAPFTGSCHYAWDCEGYQMDCGMCPAILSNDKFDQSYINLKYKERFLKNLNLRIIIGSEWLIQRAKKSSLFKDKEITKVFISVDENQFHPIQGNAHLKEKYNLSPDIFVIGFGANGLSHKRKGIQYILDSIDLIKTDKNLLFIYAGDQVIQKAFNHPTKYVGQLTRNELPDFYRLCDLFVSASLQDVGPYMILESLMCGVPVVSFNTGIASDFVMTSVTGILVEEFSSEALSDGINSMLEKNQQELAIIKNNCFENTRKKLALEKQIDDYYSLFKKDKI